MRFFLLAVPFVFACNTATLTHPPDAGAPDEGTIEEDAGLPFPTTSKINVIVEPSDNGYALINAINTAQSSIHMTMYLLSNQMITNALVARKKAGIDVKVVLNQTFPDMSDNNQAFATLQQGGVPVVWASKNFTFTHAKCVVIDGKDAWIMTMNLTYTSPSQNREYLAVDSDPRDVAEAEAIFNADFTNTPASPMRLVVSPTTSRSMILALMNYATKTLDVESETLSDAQTTQTLIAIKNKGVAVRIVTDDQPGTTAMMQALAQLKGAGIPIRKLGMPQVHAKAIVADGVAAYVGSENLTQNSLDSNREIGVLIHGSQVGTVAQTIDADFKAGTAF